MDRVAALLDGPRARGAFVLRCLLQPPWAMTVRDEAPLTLVAVVRGSAWFTQGDVTVEASAGSVALLIGPDHYDVTSSPDLEPDVVIHPGQRCETRRGESLAMSMRLGVRSWGHAHDAPTVLLVGTYEHHSALSRDVLAELPSPTVVRRPADDPLLALVASELVHDAPGQQTVLDRLLDALTVDTLRRWYVDQGANAPAWWSGHRDPIVGEALRLIHDAPEQSWTIATLARTIGTSRANLARRFSDVVGEPVIGYLTRWRLSLAADLLTEASHSISDVARQVGYGSPFALSTAFKRRYGLSPDRHRRASRTATTQLPATRTSSSR